MIELTKWDVDPTAEPCWVNPAHVTGIYKAHSFTEVLLHGRTMAVCESAEEVARLVDEATRPAPDGLHRGSPSQFMRTLREAADASNIDNQQRAWEAEVRRKGTGEILMGGGNGL